MVDALTVAKDLLAKLKRKFTDVAVMARVSDSVMVKLWNSEPSVTQSWLVTKIGLYLTKNGKVFVTEVTLPSPDKVENLAKNIMNAMQVLEPSEFYAPLPEPQTYKPLEGIYDHNVVKAMDDPGRYAELMVDAALGEGVDRVAGTLVLGRESIGLATSAGFEGSEEGTEVEAYLRSFKGEFSGHWAYGSRRLDEQALKEVGRRSGYYATLTSSKASFTPGKYDVVLSPLVIGNLVNMIALMASAMWVAMGMSVFMKFTPGSKVGSEHVTLVDAPRDPSLPGSRSFDDEGVPTYNKAIIENGVLKTLLHSTGTARRMGAKSTGNAGWLTPHPWNVHVGCGDFSGEDEMLSELKNGIVITNNWYTRLQNYVEGIFSTVSRDAAFLVRDGEIVGYLTRIRIADKISNLLHGWSAATREPYLIKWWEVETPAKAPFVLVKGVNLTKPAI